jgi:hypothetical protein
VIIREESDKAVEMIARHTETRKRGRKRTRAEQEEIEKLEHENAERVEQLPNIEEYARAKIKARKEEEDERQRQLHKQNAPATTLEGDTFGASHDIPYSDGNPISTTLLEDLTLPPLLTPSSVPFPVP